jgi:hypothetical protein
MKRRGDLLPGEAARGYRPPHVRWGGSNDYDATRRDLSPHYQPPQFCRSPTGRFLWRALIFWLVVIFAAPSR